MNEVRAGDVIAGKFEIERVLGEGGMGYVVAARHLQLGQTVALKFMRAEVLTNEYKSRFLREARNTVRLKSKHVSRVLDVGTLESGSPYMVMEYLEGVDLSELLQKRGPLPPSEACEYLLQACEAIAEAHTHGIVHRDLKPANLFLTSGSGGEPVVKVLDFGVSKVLEPGSDPDETSRGGRRPHPDSVVTKASDLLGSPSYMAPEQVISARDADSTSDVWSLGVILHRLISGKAPFTGNSLGDLIQNIMHGPMPNLRDARPDIPEGLEHVVLRCLDRDRARRPSAIELARLLAPYAGPNAAPSLERIAILGPALVTVPPKPSRPPKFIDKTVPLVVPHPKSLPPPGPAETARVPGPTEAKSGAGVLLWTLLVAALVGSIAIVVVKLYSMRLAMTAAAGEPPPPPPSPRSSAPPPEPPPPPRSSAPPPEPTPSEPLPPTLSLATAAPAPSSVTATPPSSSAPPKSTKPTPHPTGGSRVKPRQAPSVPTASPPKSTPPSPTSDIPSSRE